jgi:hypothetical protein
VEYLFFNHFMECIGETNIVFCIQAYDLPWDGDPDCTRFGSNTASKIRRVEDPTMEWGSY